VKRNAGNFRLLDVLRDACCVTALCCGSLTVYVLRRLISQMPPTRMAAPTSRAGVTGSFSNKRLEATANMGTR